MFKQIITAAAIVASFGAQAQSDSWTGPDKIKHAAVSTVLGGAGSLVFQSPKAGFVSCMAIGAAKELYDARTPNHTASAKDLAADAVGCAVGAYLGGVVLSYSSQRQSVQVGYVTRF